MNDISQIKQEAQDWDPKFEYVDSIDTCADMINLPHEDYPDYVDNTKECIENAIIILEDKGKIVENDIKQLHKICMYDKPIRVGDFRGINVKILKRDGGVHIPPQPYMVPALMISIMPIYNGVEESDIIDWYKMFETIHPFEDGNGRMGGIVIAALSYLKYGKYLTPKQ